MAILTQADYWPHVARAVRRALTDDPVLLLPLLPGLIQYARQGADQRTAVRMLLTWWSDLQGRAHNPHRLRHLLLEAGVPSAFAEDIPQTPEPAV